ncbi:hypothetical protein HDU96_001869 [Phlyctochytrium bullatum]|nr:hypothetical protein HDU96_001869 [Phlyctochytrium bullatum]
MSSLSDAVEAVKSKFQSSYIYTQLTLGKYIRRRPARKAHSMPVLKQHIKESQERHGSSTGRKAKPPLSPSPSPSPSPLPSEETPKTEYVLIDDGQATKEYLPIDDMDGSATMQSLPQKLPRNKTLGRLVMNENFRQASSAPNSPTWNTAETENPKPYTSLPSSPIDFGAVKSLVTSIQQKNPSSPTPSASSLNRFPSLKLHKLSKYRSMGDISSYENDDKTSRPFSTMNRPSSPERRPARKEKSPKVVRSSEAYNALETVPVDPRE